ncbi:hypothetical protein ACFPOU_07885 [Massilia jejuensis]|uniref:Uncharacterized protein n=1 Tax=Massilia jejuensis TaxID=648894 RepID=A0ABW0PKE9_9BURK
MKRRFFLLASVLFYVHSTSVGAATSCSEFRSDIQQIQQQVRQIEFNRSTTGLNAVQQASRLVKSSCLDQLSSLDMASFGFTPGASAMITKLANQACQRLSQELSEKINEVNQKATQGVNSAINGANIPGLSTDTFGNLGGGIQPSTTMASEPTLAGQGSNMVVDAWNKLKNMLLP